MTWGIAVRSLDSAGGPHLAESSPWYRVEGQPVAVLGDTVGRHGEDNHAAAKVTTTEGWYALNGKGVERQGLPVSCGHTSTGRPWYRLGQAGAVGSDGSVAQVAQIPRKGTVFFGGAGLEGAYIPAMVSALAEVGIVNPSAANRSRWAVGADADDTVSMVICAAPMLHFLRNGEMADVGMGIEDYGIRGPQFNLVGYSYGSLCAAQVAIKYARQYGGTTDHLVLLASPISSAFLTELRGEPLIRNVIVIDLTEHGDPVYAGIGELDLLASVPSLLRQMSANNGHFWYRPNTPEGQSRRLELSRRLHSLGLR